MKILVSFSGGKDSQASLIWAVNKFGNNSVTAIFCDTGWEHEWTYKHVNEVCEQMGIQLIILKSDFTFVSLAKKKKRFPSRKAQFCTENLKIKPMIDYILSQSDNLIIIQGIRSQESHKRAEMSKECTYFKYYLQPYFDKKGRKKFHTYRRLEVKEFIKKWSDDIIRPVFDWSGDEVMQYIISAGQKPNPLYYHGFTRVGCFPCINCNHSDLRMIAEKFPKYLKRLENAEQEVGHSFFAPSTIPKRYQSGRDSKGKYFPLLGDVVSYVQDDPNQTSIFKEEPRSCMSIYNICELNIQ